MEYNSMEYDMHCKLYEIYSMYYMYYNVINHDIDSFDVYGGYTTTSWEDASSKGDKYHCIMIINHHQYHYYYYY